MKLLRLYVLVCLILALTLLIIKPSGALAAADPLLRGPERPRLHPGGAGVDFIGRLPLYFEPNQGQFAPETRFVARTAGGRVSLTGRDMVLCATVLEEADSRAGSRRHLSLELVGARDPDLMEGLRPTVGRSHYFLGNDAAGWRRNVPHYAQVRARGVFPGVDMVYYGRQGALEFDFILAPGVDPASVRLRAVGADRVEMGDDGGLVLFWAGGRTVLSPPSVYQDTGGGRVEAAGGYQLTANGEIAFKLGEYDSRLPLVIDPTVNISTYLGGSLDDGISNIKTDDSGNIYIVGYTNSNDFPVRGPYSGQVGGVDAVVSKFTSDGRTLLYSTYLGGTLDDYGDSVVIDPSGNICLAGPTASYDFPVYRAYKKSHGSPGTDDCFLTKLSPAGDAILYSTFMGGSGTDRPYADIAMDSSGMIYLAGWTSSTNFPTKNAFQSTDSNNSSGFLAKFDTDEFAAASLIFSTLFGGNGSEAIFGVEVPASGYIYVCGHTTSTTGFPLRGPMQSVNKGSNDLFAAKFFASGAGLVYSTYIGGSGDDRCKDLAVDASGNVYLTGYTNSADFPKRGPYQGSLAGGYDGYVYKLNDTGSLPVYSTYLGGGLDDNFENIAVDSSGRAYAVGWSASNDYPVTSDAFQPTLNVSHDACITVMAADGFSLEYSTYLGGSGNDETWAVFVDPNGFAYAAGYTTSTDLPLVNPFQDTFSGGSNDGIFIKIDFGFPPLVVDVAPADRENDAAVNSRVSALFDKDMDEVTINTSTFTLEEGLVSDSSGLSGRTPLSATVMYDAAKRVAYLDPDQDLEFGQQYTVRLKTRVSDIFGRGLAADEVWTFTTSNQTLVKESRQFNRGTKASDYTIFSTPLQPDPASARQVLDPQIGTYSSTQMRIGYWNASRQNYVEYPFAMDLQPGWSGWALFRNGLNLVVAGYETPTPVDLVVKNNPPATADQRTRNAAADADFKGVTLDLDEGWNMVGNPYRFAIDTGSIVVYDDAYNPVELDDRSNQVTQQVFWTYDNGMYQAAGVLGVTEGGWIKKTSPGGGRIFFPAVAAGAADRLARDANLSDLERPPAPPAGFDEPSSGGGGGGCFIQTLTHR